MRKSFYLIVKTILLVVSVVLSNAEAAETVVRTEILSDPLFGIEYRPNEIHFENAPEIIFKCGNLKEQRGNLFLFGKTTKNKVHFYFVYGWEEVHPDGPSDGIRRFEAENDDGIIVVVSSSGCHHIGAGYALSTGKEFRQKAEKLGITKDVISKLLVDAFDREVRAFGGKTKFLLKLAEARVDESKLEPQIQDKLKLLREDKKK
jgi:hypothetical protein